MPFTLEQIVPWGRSFGEYARMFSLTDTDLEKHIFGCADGPSSFNAAMQEQGKFVVSVDPLYRFSAIDIGQRIQDVYPLMMKQLVANQASYVWRDISTPEQCGRVRLAAMEEFLDDFEQGRTEGRYLPLELPDLPFANDQFDLALCSHLLFTYSEQLSAEFHCQSVLKSESYRGKVLSLEAAEHAYSGEAAGITVHRLRTVTREQVILPPRTLELLDRNVIHFVQQREKLSQFRQATKKGILFYGPPGTGKTHTIHYLAGALAGHTTLLISAEQVTLLGEYMTLARLLQPSIVVLEDADLIARQRSQMGSPCEEVLLNKLLNEMDGLKEEADILFILTTNRPETLEAALTSRPGRIDQAIEFPLPDEEGREKLICLYAHGVEIAPEVVQTFVARTEKVSAAFIKELMRRSVQFHLERTDAQCIELEDVENALEEMLFSGGSLNLKLLGAEVKTEGQLRLSASSESPDAHR